MRIILKTDIFLAIEIQLSSHLGNSTTKEMIIVYNLYIYK